MSGDTIDELIRRLPEILKERPELAEKLYLILSDRFVTNEALKEYIEQSGRRFEDLLRTMTKRFEESDKRFEALSKRFEESDKHFEVFTKRFEESDKRFEEILAQIDRSFEAAQKHRGKN